MRTIVITACTNRKRVPPTPSLSARGLPAGEVQSVAQEWLDRLHGAEALMPADQLYCGRGFREATDAAELLQADLFVASAGLGLVAQTTRVPSYSLTVASGEPDSIVQRVRPSSASAWWSHVVASSRFSERLSALAGYCSGLTLVALPRPYLRMVEGDLLDLPQASLSRLRIFGLGIASRIHPRLEPLVMPYDGRLEGSTGKFRGTRSDFAPRALRHFTENILGELPDGSAGQHRAAVMKALAAWTEPSVPKRLRVDDEQAKRLIRKHWAEVGGRSSRMLRLLRDDLLVACEQARFQALFQAVRREREASL